MSWFWKLVAILAVIILIGKLYPTSFIGQYVNDFQNKIAPTGYQAVTTQTNLGKPGCLIDDNCKTIQSCLNSNQTNTCKCNTITGECFK